MFRKHHGTQHQGDPPWKGNINIHSREAEISVQGPKRQSVFKPMWAHPLGGQTPPMPGR